jgi:uncharacterized RDD family membrane protein YckC
MSSLDKLTIETPEQTLLEFPLAGIGSRFLALAADTAIQAVAMVCLAIAGLRLVPAAQLFHAAPQWVMAALVISTFVIYAGYFAFFETIWNGQTPGKRYIGLRVMKDDGRPIGAYDAIARNLVRLVDQLPGIYAVGIVTMLLSRQNKRLGDYVAGTVVVHERTLQAIRPITPFTSRAHAPVVDTTQLSGDEFQLIEAFLQRREELAWDVRRSMAGQIAGRLRPKLGIAPEDWPDSEMFLETLYQQVRAQGLARN